MVSALLQSCGFTESQAEPWRLAWRAVADSRDRVPARRSGTGGRKSRTAPPENVLPGIVPAQLPATIPDFVGRASEVEQLLADVGGVLACGGIEEVAIAGTSAGAGAASEAGTSISVICGPGGVGKSALALHAAHRMRESFPGGILFADLQGMAAQPADPSSVLAMFLRALGIEGQVVPAEPAARAGLLRSVTADRRLLFVLDNAHDSEQVRILLPGPGNAVLVTSRSRLAGLAGARLLQLDELSVPEATGLLAAVAGPDRVDAEPAAAAGVVDACGRLPLAVRIAGARLASRPGWSVAFLAERLVDDHHRLDELHIDDVGIRTSFTFSYAALDAVSARAFRLLSGPNAPAIPLEVASALLDLPAREAERTLEGLVDAHLLTTPQEQLYAYHDLLRLFARECSKAEDHTVDRIAALTRATRATAAQIEHNLPRPRTGVGGRREVPGAARIRSNSAHPDAQQWVEANRAGILAYLTQARNTAAIPAALAADMLESVIRAFIIAGLWTELEQCGRAILEAADREGDVRAESSARRAIGWAALYRRDLALATKMLHSSLDCAQRAEDLVGQGSTHLALGALDGARGMHQSAIYHQSRAVEIFTRLSIDDMAAVAHNYLGQQYLADGSADRALDHLRHGLVLARANNDSPVEAMSLYMLSAAHSAADDHEAAIAYGIEAVTASRTHQARYSEARALNHLGRALVNAGRTDEGRAHLAVSADLFDSIGDQRQAAAARAEASRVCASGVLN